MGNNKKEKVISWGVGFYDVKKDKNITHNVTSLFIDSQSSMMKIVVEHGINIQVINISMEESQTIGLINLDVLSKFI